MMLFPWLVVLIGGAAALSSANAPDSQHKLLVVGLGRVGRECAKFATGDGDFFDEIFGTVRSKPELSLEPTKNDCDGKLSLIPFGTESIREVVGSCTHVLITVQQPEVNDPILSEVYDIVDKFAVLDAWIGLISTTGVYGNHDGEWVTENSDLRCKENSSASSYRDYEEDWKRRCSRAVGSRRLRIFRCAGIYGGGQSALHTIYKTGYSSMDSTTFTKGDLTNRIHVSDIARAVCLSMLQFSSQSDDRWRIYNLADDLPESRAVVLQYAYEILRSTGCVIPEKQPAKTASVRESRRMMERKLVSNERLRAEILPEGLLYPTYKEGLKAILEDADSPWQCNVA